MLIETVQCRERGSSAREVVEILSSDDAKAATLAPLVVALRQHAGESVRAPDEVLEVATDIRERIATKMTAAKLEGRDEATLRDVDRRE